MVKAQLVLEKPEYVNVLLSMLRGKRYSTAIAKDLGRSQSTVVEELYQLQKSGIILKEERTKAQEYSIASSTVYMLVIERLRRLLNSIRVQLKQDRIKEIFPTEMHWRFLTNYSQR